MMMQAIRAPYFKSACDFPKNTLPLTSFTPMTQSLAPQPCNNSLAYLLGIGFTP